MERAKETIVVEGVPLDVFLPASHGIQAHRRFPLLLSLSELEAEACCAKLHAEGVIPELIVAEVAGKEALAIPVEPAKIVELLAMWFPVLNAPAARWIAGAGPHGVLALESLLDHPGMFGAAACLSSSFEGSEGAPPLHSQALHRLEERTTLPTRVRLYCDYGTLGIEECYEPYHRDLGAILRNKGWQDGKEFLIARSPGGSHSVDSWRERLGPGLRWLAAR